ncbi:hypothetical protein BDQ12DRAFT_719981 [Crucibulum laeve]|uniref:Uncharacterized protein n=1 Tax=Crucibulum laeve TaxID=68775 RepID=A0A5C3M983_9AGAR|nr:hypothetical protein BDQ12DRAFT_719981 [Crucibulum laeve]
MIHLPPIPLKLVAVVTSLPSMPLLPTLLHKLQAWLARGKPEKQRVRDKQAVDIQDIRELLAVTVLRARRGVGELMEAVPDTKYALSQTGFEAEDPAT